MTPGITNMEPSTDLYSLEENGETLQGVTVHSLLQQIAGANKSCTVQVQSGSKQGTLFMNDGILIDAEHNTFSGLEGAYKILSWDSPLLSIGKAEKRPQQIATLLSKNLLKSPQAKKESSRPKMPTPAPQPLKKVPVSKRVLFESLPEEEERPIDITFSKPQLTYTLPEAETDPLYSIPTTILSQIDAIQTFFLINMSGKVAVHSAPKADIGELIIYAIVTCSKLKKSVDTKTLKRIQMQMEDETTLLILPLAGIIIGMILKPSTSTDGIVEQIQSAIP